MIKIYILFDLQTYEGIETEYGERFTKLFVSQSTHSFDESSNAGGNAGAETFQASSGSPFHSQELGPSKQ